MPFGLQGAPGIFQEMMEEVYCRTRAKLKETFPKVEHFFLSAVFDDIGVGTQNNKDQVQVLQILLRLGEKKSSLSSNRESGLGVPILGSQEAGEGKSILGLGGPFITGEPPPP